MTMKRNFALFMVALFFAGVLWAEGATRNLDLFYYKQENQEGWQKIVGAFQISHPDIRVRLLITPNDEDASMQMKARNGKLPALIQMPTYARITEYAKKGYLKALDDTVALQRVIESSLPSVAYNGHSYGLPMDYSAIGLLYNRKIFQKLGLEAPKTFTDLKNACDTLKLNSITPFAALLKENWSAGHFISMVHTMLLAQKCAPQDQKGEDAAFKSFLSDMNAGNIRYSTRIDKDKLFEVLDFYRDNIDAKAYNMDGPAQVLAFARGEAAMMVQGLWSYTDAKKANPSLDVGFVPFPIFDEVEKNKPYADVDSAFVVSSQASLQQQKDATEFLDWLSSDAGRALWVDFYRLTHSFKGGNFKSLGLPYSQMMAVVAERGSYPWLFARYPTKVFEDACKNGAQQYLLKGMSEEALLRSIDEAWQGE